MLRGLPASLIFHGAVIFGGSVAWPYIAPEREVIEIVPVTMDIQLDITTNLAPVIRREVAPEIPEPEEDAAEEEDLEEEGEDAELSEDEIDTTDVRELPQDELPEEESTELSEDEQEKEDEPEEQEDEQKAEARRRDPDDLDSILGDASALFSEQDQTRRTPPKKPKKVDAKLSDVEDPRKGVGDRSKETARVEAMIASQMRVCWDDVIDLPNPERLNVEIRVRLNEDGSLDGDIEPLKPRRPPVGDRPMSIAYERALRAARKCAPYKLPKDAQSSYDGGWDVVNFRIGPGFGQ